MANPQTTHVIEIETGIGEPAFIPLSMGHELQPISVGKKGMWRIESPRVLDVHAFVYFDGTSLFLQSADEQNAASVDGYRVGKAWTELHAPCKIEIGNARLRYRSLLADADNQPTMMAPSAPVQAGPGGPGGPLGPTGSRPGGAPGAPGASMPVAGAPPPPPGGGASGSAPGMSFPKAERPFKPGEFSSAPDTDESTRIAPLDSTGGGRVASGSHPRPAAGQPGDDPSTRPEAARVMGGQSGAVRAVGGPFDGGMGMQSSPMMQPDMGQQSGAFPQQGYPQQQQGFPNQGYPGAGGSGAYGAIPGAPGMPAGMGPSMPPGGYGSMTPQGGMQQPGGPQAAPNDFVSKLKANSIPKIVAGLLFIVGGILYLAEDDDPQPVKKKPVAALDGGSVEGGLAAGGGSTAGTGTGTSTGPAPTTPPVLGQGPGPGPIAPAWPAGVPCPPPNWPPNTPLPCTPNGITSTPDRTPPERGGKDAGAKGGDSKDAGTTLPAGVKTLERQAVDYVAAGETSKAAAAYEELVRRDPNNKVYAEAARILRAKLDAGAQ